MSELGSIFRSLANGGTPPSAQAGNSSWWAGSAKQSKVPSYVTVLKAPKANSEGDAVQAHFGLDIKTGKTGKAKKKHGGLLDSILGGAKDVTGNLVSDVINTAEGTPAGLLKLATTNPIDSAKAIGHDYATRYGKLFKGDFGGFAHDIEKHPFGYLLDASSLGTGSGAVLGRLAPTLAKGGEVALRVDRAASKAGEVANTTKQLSRNPFTRNVFEKPAYALQRTLPNIPVVGERATAIRHLTGQVESRVGSLGHAQQVFEKTVRDVRHANSKDDTLLQAFDRVSADLRHRPLQTLGKGIARPFNPKLDTNIAEAGVRHSDAITAIQNQIKSEIELNTQGQIVAKAGASATTHSFLKVHNARETLNQSVVKLEDSVTKANAQGIANKVAKNKLNPTVDMLGKKPEGIPKTSLGGKFTSANEPRMLQPGPNPDFIPATANYKTGKFTPSKGDPMLPLRPNPAFREAKATYSKASEAYRSNIPGKGIPATNVGRVAQSTAQHVAPKTASFLDGIRTVDTHSDPVANYLEMHGKAIKSAGNAISKDFLDTYGKDPRLARELTGIFDKHSAAGSLSGSFNKATQIWKDLILVGRPAFLVNNFVGNQVMYHLKQGAGGVSLQKAASKELNEAFDNHFFEHRQSLGSSEQAAPRFNKEGQEIAPSAYRRNANKVYNVQSRHEQILRKATMREAALSIPAIKTEVRRLIGKDKLSEGTALNRAMTKAFKENPGYREIIGKAIDDTMGNYRHYNKFEQGLKQIVPFYGWNRHALRTYTSIIKDQPGTANVIANVGKEGQAENAKMFPGTPDFMKTYITGKLGTFDTQALNPLKGGSDTIRSIKELVAGNPGNMPAIASNLNPFISGSAQALSGVNLTTGAPITNGGGLVGSVLGQTIGGLPQVKIGKLGLGTSAAGDRSDPHYFLTATGQLKRKFKDSEGKVKFGPDGLPLEAADRHMLQPSFENSALSWLGIPKRNVNLKTAQIVKKSIDSKIHPASDFHKRKTAKKKIKAIVNMGG